VQSRKRLYGKLLGAPSLLGCSLSANSDRFFSCSRERLHWIAADGAGEQGCWFFSSLDKADTDSKAFLMLTAYAFHTHSACLQKYILAASKGLRVYSWTPSNRRVRVASYSYLPKYLMAKYP